MNKKKERLLLSAAQLYDLGIKVEDARGELRALVERHVPFDAPEMLAALDRFEALNAQWKALEQEHLALRDGTIKS